MKQVIGFGVALAAALVGSYLTWTDDSEPVAVEGVPVYRTTPSELQSVAWASDSVDVTLSKRSDDKGDYHWLEVTERKQVERPVLDEAPADESTDGDDPEAPPTPRIETVEVVTEVAFKGNDAAAQVWEAFAPLEALRELTDTPGLDRSVFGLEEPEGRITVTRKGGEPVQLVVGGETYGSKDRYATAGERVFLLDDADLRPLQFAMSRLVDRVMYPLARPEMTAASLTLADGRGIEAVHVNPDDESKEYWTLATTPDDRNDEVDALLDRALLLRFRAYVTEAEATAGGALTPAYTFTVSGDGQTWPIEVLRRDDDTWFARAAYNRSLVQLTDNVQAPGVERELRELLDQQ
jgi:hypothetical protein